eukprot:1474621-Alexandrium_andersonii.AAC.1
MQNALCCASAMHTRCCYEAWRAAANFGFGCHRAPSRGTDAPQITLTSLARESHAPSTHPILSWAV